MAVSSPVTPQGGRLQPGDRRSCRRKVCLGGLGRLGGSLSLNRGLGGSVSLNLGLGSAAQAAPRAWFCAPKGPGPDGACGRWRGCLCGAWGGLCPQGCWEHVHACPRVLGQCWSWHRREQSQFPRGPLVGLACSPVSVGSSGTRPPLPQRHSCEPCLFSPETRIQNEIRNAVIVVCSLGQKAEDAQMGAYLTFPGGNGVCVWTNSILWCINHPVSYKFILNDELLQ